MKPVSYKFDDTSHQVFFYMNKNGKFIILDKKENVINDFFPPRIGMEEVYKNIYKEYKKCKNIIEIKERKLFFFQRKNEGLGHSISLLVSFIRLATQCKKTTLIIPDSTHPNIINLITNIIDFTILKKNTIYKIDKMFFSKFLDMLHPLNGRGSKCVTPYGPYPLISQSRAIFWFRTKINNYIDFKMKPLNKYDKIFVGKFEGQGEKNGKIHPPRSDYGMISKELVSRFERNGFVTIDPYKHHIHEVIWYIRHCKELILSTGSAATIYTPYLSKKTFVYYMTNVPKENFIYDDNRDKNSHLIKNNDEYNEGSYKILRFLTNYRICFYKSNPIWRKGKCRASKFHKLYDGEDMLDFLKIK